MPKALKDYAALLKKSAKINEAMGALEPDVKKELRAIKGGITTVDGVKFYVTRMLLEVIYPKGIQKIIIALKTRLDIQKKLAENSKLTKKKYLKTFAAQVLEPKKL